MSKINIKVVSFEEKHAKQQLKNKIKLAGAICITVIGYMLYKF
jgi:hypothetical protein